MLRYVSLVWDEDNETCTEVARGFRRQLTSTRAFQVVLDLPGLILLWVPPQVGSDGIHTLADRCGVILGTVFENRSEGSDYEHLEPRLDPSSTRVIVASAARAMITKFWGSYVAFVSNKRAKVTYILRGPVSHLLCFYSRCQGVDVFFSTIDDYASLRSAQLTVNWDCVRAQLASGNYLSRETALSEISSLGGGECAQLHAGRCDTLVYWTPGEIARSQRMSDFEDASAALRATTQRCINAWASRHRRILHQLSGGLDSSIVLGCLRRAPSNPAITCLNLYSTRGGDDERNYARCVATRNEVELIEMRRNSAADFRLFLTCARTAYPVLNFSAYDSDIPSAELASKLGATALFDGELGDELFGRWPGHEALTEYMRHEGCNRGLFRAGMDFALLRRVSIWSALYPAVRGFLERTPDRWDANSRARKQLGYDLDKTTLVDSEVLRAYEQNPTRFLHSWFSDAAGVPLGQFNLILALLMITSPTFHPPFAKETDPPQVHPLVSQPLVEVALRIATHLHFRNGRERALARHAFREYLPQLVLDRTGKAAHERLMGELLDRNREFLKDVLLDGILVRERLISRKKLEEMLSGGVSRSSIPAADVIEKLYIEAWLRHWVPL